MAHLVGAWIGGEIGHYSSLETGKVKVHDGSGFDGAMSCEQLLKDADETAEFVRRTEVDALTISIDTSHGAYKISCKPDGDILAMDALKKFHAKPPDTPLGCMVLPPVRKRSRTLSTNTGGESRQHWAYP